MGQPTPPGDIPFVEGLPPEWNEIVEYIPEDKRAEFGPKLKERLNPYTELESWRDLHKSGVTPDQAGSALNLYSIIENQPKQVYDIIGKSLGLTTAEAQQVVEELEEAEDADPQNAEIKALKNQVETLVQIQLAQHNRQTEEQRVSAEETKIENDLKKLKKTYGEENVDEEHIVMRMLQKGLTAEQAYAEHASYVDQIRARRPAPTIMGGGGAVPNKAIDVKKLDSKDTKSLVAQMLSHANAVNKQ